MRRPGIGAKALEPALCVGALTERLGVGDRQPADRDGGGLDPLGRRRLAPASTAAGAGAARTDGADDEDATGGSLRFFANQVAAVVERGGTGEFELCEAEERRGYSPRWASLERPFIFLAGSAASEGSVGTTGWSISPMRSISLCHWLGLSRRLKREDLLVS